MLQRLSVRLGRYYCSKVSGRLPFEQIRDKPVTNFKEAYDLIDGVFENKYKLSYSNIKTMVSKTEKILFHSQPSYKFIKIYLIMSKLKLIDNFQRRVFVEKILGGLNKLQGIQLVNALYFLITNCPFYDLSVIEDCSLRLMEISKGVGDRSFNEYLFGMKTDFVLKYAGFETPLRRMPGSLQSEEIGRVLALPHCISELHPQNQQTYDKMQKLMYVYLQHQYSLYLLVQSQTNQQDTAIHDPTTYEDLALLYEILGTMQFQSQIQVKINSIFTRKIHQSPIDFMSAVRILKQLKSMQTSHSSTPLKKMLLDIIYSIEKDQLVNVPIKSIIEFLSLLEEGDYRTSMMRKLDRVIVRMDMYDEEVEAIGRLYKGMECSKEMRELIERE